VDRCYRLLLLHGFQARKGFRTVKPGKEPEWIFHDFVLGTSIFGKKEIQLDLAALRFTNADSSGFPFNFQTLGLEVQHRGSLQDAIERLNSLAFLDFKVVVTTKEYIGEISRGIQILSVSKFEEWLKKEWKPSCPLHPFEEPPLLFKDEEGSVVCPEKDLFLDFDDLVSKYEASRKKWKNLKV